MIMKILVTSSSDLHFGGYKVSRVVIEFYLLNKFPANYQLMSEFFRKF